MPKEEGQTATRTRRTKADGTTKRKKKDPNAPKRALSPYMIFASENRQMVLETNPGITFGQVGKKLGELWGQLDEAGKQPYVTKAAADKERYAKEMEQYEAEKA